MTVPIIFDRGILAFQSQKERYAVFFAFRASSSVVKVSNAARVLTILMKILPTSTICSFEWISKDEFFVNFFIKLGKEAFLTRIKELEENISTSLTTLFSLQNVQMLEGEELVAHFTMGISGSIRQVSIRGKNALLLKSHETSMRRVFSCIGPLNAITVGQIFDQKPNNPNLRIILSFKREETNLTISDSLVMVSKEPVGNFQSSEPIQISKISAYKAIRHFGDIISRNFIVNSTIMLDYPSSAELILHQISSVNSKQSAPTIRSDQTELGERIDPLTWRTQLAKLSASLGLPYSKDVQVLMSGVPTRFDAKVSNLLVLIISQDSESQINWTVQQSIALLNSSEETEFCFLVTNLTQFSFLEYAISQTPLSKRFHIASNYKELEIILKKYRERVVTDRQLLTQVA
ncbi:MAG: hypothetical protein Q6361_07165 [Candidatus Hermodarchaeota archaeon]|nr:hypothetical protein [Candidatus Hermodarchaeota archaeon]